MSDTREIGIIRQVVWKSFDMQRLCIALVQAAQAHYLDGVGQFASDDIPDADRPGDIHMTGNAMHILTAAHIIEPVLIPGTGQILRRRSRAESAKDRFINVYKLCSLTAAQTFLERNGVEQRRQGELFGKVG